MKRRILSSMLAAALLSQTAGAVFNDIEDTYTQQAASSLAGMGIVSGTGYGLFEPDRLLSRAEFTRLAVSAMGVSNVDNYSSYTIFPDVPAGHWAAGWVNAAVRHPALTGGADEKTKAEPIIRGLADGTFGPSNIITLGEGCTIVLRMLGYEPTDVGPFWPNDYVTKAQALGLLRNLPSTDPGGALTRGNAAILFRNTLTAKTKKGESMLSTISGGTPIEHAILVATGETDSTLTASEATFYEESGGERGEEGKPSGALHTRKLVGAIDASVVGSQGVIIFDKDRPDHVRGFLPDQSTSREVVPVRVDPDGLSVEETGFIEVPRHTPLVAFGEVHEYGTNWFDLPENTPVILNYDANGILQTVSSSAAHYQYPLIIAGVNGSAKDIPARWKIMRNGKEMKPTDLKKYDVITLDSSTQTALVCSNRLTGQYEKASPTFRYPEKITVMGAELPVSAQFATCFETFEPDDRITVLFDVYGRVCGATNDRAAVTPMEGVVVGCSEASVSVRLFNGITVSGEPRTRIVEDDDGVETEVTSIDDNAVGAQVTVSQNGNGKLSVKRVLSLSSTPHKEGNWDVEGRLIGYTPVSPNVQVYERVDISTPLSPISIRDIPMDVVPASQIVSTQTDSTGAIVTIVLKDVTGESWIYGMVKDTTIEIEQPPYLDEETGEMVYPDPEYDYRVTITTLIDGKSAEQEFKLHSSVRGTFSSNHVAGLPASALSNNLRTNLSVQVPERVDTVGLEAFTGYSAVDTQRGYYPIADDVPVYVRKSRKCITLREAKANYTSFELYAEKDVNEGGKIRIIVV